MTKDEFQQVMTVAASCDPRLTVNVEVLRAWYAICGHCDQHEVLTRIKRHYSAETRCLMPVDLLGGKQTPQPQTLPQPPVDPDDVPRYLAWTQTYSRALAWGADDAEAQAQADTATGAVRLELPRRPRPVHLLTSKTLEP